MKDTQAVSNFVDSEFICHSEVFYHDLELLEVDHAVVIPD